MRSPKEQYEAALAELATQVGERNRRLLSLAFKARNAGVEEDAAVEDIIAAGGEPRLGRGEVSRAVRKAYGEAARTALATRCASSASPRQIPVIAPYRGRGRTPLRPAPGTRHPAPGTSSYSFVRAMIAAGGGEASSADLIALSPIAIRKLPYQQACDFAARMEQGADELYYVGAPTDPRDRAHLMTMDELTYNIVMESHFTIPTHFLPNVVSGEPVKNEKGQDSYAKEECLAHRRYAVVEFDEMPLREQASFWKGMILSKVAPIRSLVYSGNKSIHGLLMMDETRDFAEQWKDLADALASDKDRAYRCDLACRNPGRLTRFPGGVREMGGKRRYQCLLYLA